MAYGVFHRTVQAALAKAPAATRAALQLQQEYLAPVQADNADGPPTQDEVTRQLNRAFLYHITMRDLTGSDGKFGAASWMYNTMGDHVTHAARADVPFNVNVDIIARQWPSTAGIRQRARRRRESRGHGRVGARRDAPGGARWLRREAGRRRHARRLRTRASCWSAKEGEGKVETHTIKQRFANVVANFDRGLTRFPPSPEET